MGTGRIKVTNGLCPSTRSRPGPSCVLESKACSEQRAARAGAAYAEPSALMKSLQSDLINRHGHTEKNSSSPFLTSASLCVFSYLCWKCVCLERGKGLLELRRGSPAVTRCRSRLTKLGSKLAGRVCERKCFLKRFHKS